MFFRLYQKSSGEKKPGTKSNSVKIIKCTIRWMVPTTALVLVMHALNHIQSSCIVFSTKCLSFFFDTIFANLEKLAKLKSCTFVPLRWKPVMRVKVDEPNFKIRSDRFRHFVTKYQNTKNSSANTLKLAFHIQREWKIVLLSNVKPTAESDFVRAFWDIFIIQIKKKS